MRARAGLLLALGLSCCSVGRGEGWVHSDDLKVPECWDGRFDLEPDFFAANPYRNQALMIRIQRGDDIQELSNGLSLVVPDLSRIRQALGQDLPIGLPPGVANPNTPPGSQAQAPVSMALYLQRSCRFQNTAIYALEGTIRFAALFSGDPNEESGAERLTEARFSAIFGDPRLPPEDQNGMRSNVEGYFKFYFQRGQPAQPFQ